MKNRINIGIVLFLVFLVLKLTGNINISWFWVTSPIWIPFILTISIILCLIITISIMISVGLVDPNELRDKIKDIRKNKKDGINDNSGNNP
jgi:uncharacterized integral membrane protein